MNKRLDYAKKYLSQYLVNLKDRIDKETSFIGKSLINNAKGNIINLGCGPCPHIWAFFMVNANKIDNLDIAPESIKLYKQDIKNLDKYKAYENFIKLITKNKDYSLKKQVKKIKSIKVGDFSKNIKFKKYYYDTVIFSFSLGCVKNIKDFNDAIKNAYNLLKNNGTLMIFGTNGKNSNKILSDYTWQGLNQNTSFVINSLKIYGFKKIKKFSINVKPGLYNYNKIHLINAIRL